MQSPLVPRARSLSISTPAATSEGPAGHPLRAASVERRRAASKQAIGDNLEPELVRGTCEGKQGQQHAGSKPAKRMAQPEARMPHPEPTLARVLFLRAPSQPPPHFTVTKTIVSCKDFFFLVRSQLYFKIKDGGGNEESNHLSALIYRNLTSLANWGWGISGGYCLVRSLSY